MKFDDVPVPDMELSNFIKVVDVSQNGFGDLKQVGIEFTDSDRSAIDKFLDEKMSMYFQLKVVSESEFEVYQPH